VSDSPEPARKVSNKPKRANGRGSIYQITKSNSRKVWKAGHMNQRLVQGQRVLVSHLQGQEEGTIESVNYKTGKVLVFFNQKECPHYDSFNLSQVTPIPLIVIGETNTEITN